MQTFTPFPLRARGLLEIFDAAIKLYKQYFWVLLGWSAIVSLSSVFGSFLPFGGMASIFIGPLSIGSVVCCVAAAVRGQNVEFGQCWRFTQPRYWMMLGMQLLSFLIGGIILMVLAGLITALAFGAVYLFRGSSGLVQIVMGIIGVLILCVVGTILSAVVVSWITLVPIVVCMEEDKRGTTALNRAYEILRGHWLKITTLLSVVGLALLTIMGMLAGLASLLMGIGTIGDMINGRGFDETALWVGIGAAGMGYIVFLIISTPLMYLIVSVFYLDIRVRQEALDLEWTAHTTAPPIAAYPAPIGANPTFIATPEQTYPHQQYSPPPATPENAVENIASADHTNDTNTDVVTQSFAPLQNPFGTQLLSDENETGSTPSAPV